MYAFIYEYIKNIFIYELRLLARQESPVPRRRHDCVDHDLEGLHPVDVVEVVQHRVERDHCCDLLLVHAVVPH